MTDVKRALTLDDSQLHVLNQWVRSRTASIRWRARAQIILAVAKGGTDQTIAAELGTTRHRVESLKLSNDPQFAKKL